MWRNARSSGTQRRCAALVIDLLPDLAAGEAVTLIPIHAELPTRKVADILCVRPRPEPPASPLPRLGDLGSKQDSTKELASDSDQCRARGVGLRLWEPWVAVRPRKSARGAAQDRGHGGQKHPELDGDDWNAEVGRGWGMIGGMNQGAMRTEESSPLTGVRHHRSAQICPPSTPGSSLHAQVYTPTVSQAALFRSRVHAATEEPRKA